MPRELMSAEEFREYVDNTLDRDDVTDEYQLIYNARDWYSKSRNARLEESEKDYYKILYIKRLLDFGFRSKGRWDDSGYQAQERFERALGLDQNLPIAHYRLGHIYYRQEKFAQASASFEKSLGIKPTRQEYGLDDIQQAHACKVMAFCALKTFENVKASLIGNSCYPEQDELIQSYVHALSNEICPVVVEGFSGLGISRKQVTYKQYLDLKDEASDDVSLLYFDTYSTQTCVGYQGKEEPMSYDNILLILKLLEGEDVDLYDHIRAKTPNQDTIRNSLNQKIRRLRMIISTLGLSPEQFKIVVPPGEQPRIQTSLTLIFFKRIEE